jgi:hypothetical protein
MKAFLQGTTLFAAVAVCHLGIGRSQAKAGSWLDDSKPAAWNKPGASIPAAPKTQGAVDARCRERARPAESAEDKRVRDQGWNLEGPYQGGWQVVVIRGTAGYDGMCQPWQYQAFVFVRGVFAGTLSPQAMDSRTDGALGQVYLQSSNQLTAEYHRYAATDAACCPSSKTSVVYEIASDGPVLKPLSTSTAPNK